MSGKETLYAKVTNDIIREREIGVAPWMQPWSAGAEDVSLPYNAATNREYSGINIPILWGTAIACGFTLPRCPTFRQAKELGGRIRTGEQGTTVAFAKSLSTRTDDTDEDNVGASRGAKPRTAFRLFTVFNVVQCDVFLSHLATSCGQLEVSKRRSGFHRISLAPPSAADLDQGHTPSILDQ